MTETVQEMVDSVYKVTEDRDLSKKIVRQILNDFGGLQVYLPMGDHAFKKEIDAEIYEAYNGSNVRELCRKYKISFNTLYNAYKREKDRRSKKAEKEAIKELDLF